MQQALNPVNTGVLSANQQERELIPAQAAKAILIIDHLHEARGGLLQQQVAHGMPEAIVDLLESVDIQNQYGQALLSVDRLLQALVEQHPVRQTGDHVIMGQALQLRLGLLEFAVAQVDQVVAAVELGDKDTEQPGTGQCKQEQG
ncbi:hypothetical protein D3C77_325450 [compost metagenome]